TSRSGSCVAIIARLLPGRRVTTHHWHHPWPTPARAPAAREAPGTGFQWARRTPHAMPAGHRQPPDPARCDRLRWPAAARRPAVTVPADRPAATALHRHASTAPTTRPPAPPAHWPDRPARQSARRGGPVARPAPATFAGRP